MPKQLFAIVGYTDWGKSNTLYQLFDRWNFQPLKLPITPPKFKENKFTVINASNEDLSTARYLERLQEVLELQAGRVTVFVITISLIFNNPTHNANDVFDFLNTLPGFDNTYLVLDHGWKADTVLKESDLKEMKRAVRKGAVLHFEEIINESEGAFIKRTTRIAEAIQNKLRHD